MNRDVVVAARVSPDLRADLEALVEAFRSTGARYPDGRDPDLSYVARLAYRELVDRHRGQGTLAVNMGSGAVHFPATSPSAPAFPLSATAPDGARARDVAVERAERGADPAWLEAAAAAIRTVAGRGPFTTDDVWKELDRRGAPDPREPRALGAVMTAARRAGTIAPTDRFKPTDRAAGHRSPKRIWTAA